MGDPLIIVSPAQLDAVARELDRASSETFASTQIRFFGEWPMHDEMLSAHRKLRGRFRANHKRLQNIATASREFADAMRNAEDDAEAAAVALLVKLNTPVTKIEGPPQSPPTAPTYVR